MPTSPRAPASPAPIIPVGMEAPPVEEEEALEAPAEPPALVTAADVVRAPVVTAAVVLEYLPVAFAPPPDPVVRAIVVGMDVAAAPPAVRKYVWTSEGSSENQLGVPVANSAETSEATAAGLVAA